MIIEAVRKIGTANHVFESAREVAEVKPTWDSWDGKDDGYAPDEYHMYERESVFGGRAGVIRPSSTPGEYAAYHDLDGALEYVGNGFGSVLDAAKALLGPGPVSGGGYYRKGGKRNG
ncbi:hypothetical protein ACIRLA_28715 [Streptomyces sp. NPDC102364]|uniref:hypothetical protein n=1 Tax=Streptomyces sp. NPDC102364 TaxID=3366161 RepID=UPI00382FD2C7